MGGVESAINHHVHGVVVAKKQEQSTHQVLKYWLLNGYFLGMMKSIDQETIASER